MGLGTRWVSVWVLILLLPSCENTLSLSFPICQMGIIVAVPPRVVTKINWEKAPKVFAERKYSINDTCYYYCLISLLLLLFCSYHCDLNLSYCIFQQNPWTVSFACEPFGWVPIHLKKSPGNGRKILCFHLIASHGLEEPSLLAVNSRNRGRWGRGRWRRGRTRAA